MKLLILSEREGLEDQFDPYFDEVQQRNFPSTRINLLQNEQNVFVEEESAENYDCLFFVPEPELIIYARVMLEKLEKELQSNLDSTSSYILVKKQYLYKVLNERDVPIPQTVVIGSPKSVSAIKNLNYPAVGRIYEGFKEREKEVLHNKDEVKNFAEPVEYGEEVSVLQDFVEGDVFDCLVIGDEVVSLKLSNEGKWSLPSGESKEKYYKVSSEVRNLAVKARKAIGPKVCRVKIVEDKVVNMSPDPQLGRFEKASGKNTYEKMANLLQDEE